MWFDIIEREKVMINVVIDELSPCLIDAKTGDLVATEAMQITDKAFLTDYNKENGWYADWEQLLANNEIYALITKETKGIQGMVALREDKLSEAIYITWMCSSPENDRHTADQVKYIGVGGHLFAIAVQKSIKYGFGGVVHGFAANEQLLTHYIDAFGGKYIGILHPFHFCIDEADAGKIAEVYDYEWAETKI